MHEASPTIIKDAVKISWIDALPKGFLAYAQLMRLDRPIGWWLLLLPCWWSLTLAQIAKGGGWPNFYFAALFLVGAIIMRGAGCVLNDLADRDIDAKVERTKSRPLPSGRITTKSAVIFSLRTAGAGIVGCIAIQHSHDQNRNCFFGHRCNLPLHEAHHLLAAICLGPRIQLGRYHRVDGDCGHNHPALPHALRRRHFLDTSL
jgi:hypothetical protein